jgi:hypothetical protein
MSAHHRASNAARCPQCTAALCVQTCRACNGVAATCFFLCEECGGEGQVFVCPNQAAHGAPASRETEEQEYWRGRLGQFSNPFRSARCAGGQVSPISAPANGSGGLSRRALVAA